jgi:magnesium-translocating P-type ATPase
MRRKEQAGRSAKTEAAIFRFARMERDELFERLNSRSEGLTSEEAEVRLEENGENVIDVVKRRSPVVRFVLSFINPFNLVLFIVAIAAFFTEVLFTASASWATIIMIFSLIIISGVLQFVQETRSDKAAEKLKAMVSSNAAVLRDGKFSEMPMRGIVSGDIVRLSAGDMIPADLRILSAKDLFIGQAALTGESEPVEKFAELKKKDSAALESSDICFMGTNVVSGNATGAVIGAGNDTYFGSIAKSLVGRRAQTTFEKGVAGVSRLLLRMTLILVPVIFLVNGILKSDWIGSLLFALAVAVGITPELLPVILTSTLAKGAVAMSRRKTIVKNLASIQSFGGMDILCTDKTGTLTEDKIILERYLDIHGNEDLRVLRHAYLNSWFQTGLKNLLDFAIISRAEKEGHQPILDNYKKVDEIPFDFSRRRMSVVLTDKSGKRQLITKGAVEEMLACCSFAEYGGQVLPLSEQIRAEVLRIADGLNSQGLRVIAVAQKNSVGDISAFGVKDESDMVLIGYVGFLDPPKESSKAAIKALHNHGVRVIVLTGDNEKVAASVCAQVGLDASRVLLGGDVERLTDKELGSEAEKINLFAKLSPAQKKRVVSSLQENGHTVGYLGDGINDAPALHRADVGITVDSAVDIAKESADIILLEKSLMVLEEGVIEGRRIFGNINKYIKMATSGNFGNMFSLLFASIFLPFLPILPIQILAQNLLYDVSQIAIPFDRMDAEYLIRPQNWDAGAIRRFMFWFGPLSSLFDIITFLILYFVFKANTPANQALFQTGWFMVGLATQTLIVHLIRTSRVPIIESRASKPLLISTLVITAIGLALPYTLIGAALDMVFMPPVFFLWFACIIVLYAFAVQVLKKLYIGRYKTWI